MTIDKPDITRADAENVVAQLEQLREALTPSEGLVLDTVVQAFADRVAGADPAELLAGFPEASELLDDVAGYAATYIVAPGEPQRATPVTTITVTTVTIAASSDLVTCNIAANPRQPRG